MDCRAFGRLVLVGTHIISNLSQFIFKPPDKSKMFTGKFLMRVIWGYFLNLS